MNRLLSMVQNKQKLCRNCKQKQQLLTLMTTAATSNDIRNGIIGGKNHKQKKNEWKYKSLLAVIGMGMGVTGGLVLYQHFLDDKKNITSNPKSLVEKNLSPSNPLSKNNNSNLPTYKMEEVRKHNSLKTGGVWVTYGKGVYDVTKFVPEHPGGDKIIMLAAGGAIDPFWHIYQQHNTEQVLNLLETFKIGNLSPEDDVGISDLGSPWAAEPKRHPILKPTTERPFNGEPPASILSENFITPTEFFYVRNHLPVPVTDEQSYELEIAIEGTDVLKIFKLGDIKLLPKHTITAAIMCGGNRRSEMNQVKEVKGISWGVAAVGNTRWTGARLRDILKVMGIEGDEKRHVIFEGMDLDPTSSPYAASIPLSKAMDERGDVLLAYEMDGKPLIRDHGYPLRVVVPGVVGARNVKWVTRIVISENESDSHWQQRDYKGFSPSTDWNTVDFSKSPAIQNMPVTSAICSPQSEETVKVENGCITVKGYAWSGGGNKIVRVDLTADGGNTWHVAELEQDNAPAGRHWAWTLWTAKIPVNNETQKNVEIWAKAVDSNYNSQPESFRNIWNLRGVLNNAYHRVKVNLT